MTHRFAIVGLGNAAQTIHLPALRKLHRVKCVGGCDTGDIRSKFPFPVFTSMAEMLEKTRPEIVIVATPPTSHYRLASQALAAGCHVFCEKPLAETVEEAAQLTAIAERANRHLVVNSEFPWMPIHAAAKRRIGRPGFGELQFVSMQQTFVVTPSTEEGWRGRELRRTFKDFGTHVLDLAAFFFGEPPKSVRARMPRFRSPDSPDHLCLIEMEFSGDRWAHILLDRLAKGRHRYLDVRLDGSEGTIETSIGGRLQATVGISPGRRRPFADLAVAMGGIARLYHGEHFELLARAPLNVFADATSHLLQDVLTALESGIPPPSRIAVARKTFELLLACYDSAGDGLPRELI